METTVTSELHKQLLELVMQKKELQTIEQEYAIKILDEVLRKQAKVVQQIPVDLTQKQLPKNKIVKDIVSEVRATLREVYGVFKRKNYKTPDQFDEKAIQKVLLTHQSSYERIDIYKEAYKKIFEKLSEQGLTTSYSLMDLACGLNPLSYDQLPNKPKNVFAGDLSSQDMELIQQYFDERKLSGSAEYTDLLDETILTNLEKKKFDVCILFKALDSLETIKRHSSKKLLSVLNVKFLVVSFALKSIGGKNSIGNNRRWWFEGFCRAQEWPFESFIVDNELFYVVKKQ